MGVLATRGINMKNYGPINTINKNTVNYRIDGNEQDKFWGKPNRTTEDKHSITTLMVVLHIYVLRTC